jgi:hypothetical protein
MTRPQAVSRICLTLPLLETWVCWLPVSPQVPETESDQVKPTQQVGRFTDTAPDGLALLTRLVLSVGTTPGPSGDARQICLVQASIRWMGIR